MPEQTADFDWFQSIRQKNKFHFNSMPCVAFLSIRRIFGWLLFAFVVMFSSELWSAPSSTHQHPITFKHFGLSLTLQPSLSGYQLTYAGQQIEVKLNNRLIVRAKTSVTAPAIQAAHPAIEQVQQLAVLTDSVLWLVHTEQLQFSDVLQHLPLLPGVLYAQPDLQQQRFPAKMATTSMATPFLNDSYHFSKRTVRVAVIDDGFLLTETQNAPYKLLLQYDADLHLADASAKLHADQHGNSVLQLLVQSSTSHATSTLQPELIAIRQVSTITSDIVLAFAVARMMKADVVNSSWLLSFLPEPLFDLLTDWSTQSQPYLVFAAGNQQQDACLYNAFSQLTTAIIVAATTIEGQLTRYSNYGPCIDIYAPGHHSLVNTSSDTRFFSGTSAAAAFVSGQLVKTLSLGQTPDWQLLSIGSKKTGK